MPVPKQKKDTAHLTCKLLISPFTSPCRHNYTQAGVGATRLCPCLHACSTLHTSCSFAGVGAAGLCPCLHACSTLHTSCSFAGVGAARLCPCLHACSTLHTFSPSAGVGAAPRPHVGRCGCRRAADERWPQQHLRGGADLDAGGQASHTSAPHTCEVNQHQAACLVRCD
eukprot:362107-Chlamydomonas_euryale.AAC.1